MGRVTVSTESRRPVLGTAFQTKGTACAKKKNKQAAGQHSRNYITCERVGRPSIGAALQCVSFLVIYTQNPGWLGVASGSKTESVPRECFDVIGASAV